MMRISRFMLAAIVGSAMSLSVRATTIFTDNFNTAGSATNYNIFQTTGAGSVSTGSVTFGFDYSTLGIPSAPNSGDSSTLGLRVQSDQTATTTSDVIGAISVVTKNLNLPSTYQVQVDVWGNYIGGTTINDAGGTNSSTGATIATGVKGATYSSATTNGSSNEGGFLTDAIRDATSAGGTYRVYLNAVNTANTAGQEGIYAASSGSSDATAGQYTNAYYTSRFPAVSAPAAQSGAASTQTGSTQAGEFGFAWHTVTITNDGTNTTWAIDGSTIATVADSAYTNGGSQLSLGDQDGNTSPGTSANQQLYNFDLFDNLIVTATPEPASAALLGLGSLGLLIRRRKA